MCLFRDVQHPFIMLLQHHVLRNYLSLIGQVKGQVHNVTVAKSPQNSNLGLKIVADANDNIISGCSCLKLYDDPTSFPMCCLLDWSLDSQPTFISVNFQCISF